LIESPTSATVIWDSDCVPTRNVQIFNQTNNPVYMKVKEKHQPYFEMIAAENNFDRESIVKIY
jgi:hypothetical protein